MLALLFSISLSSTCPHLISLLLFPCASVWEIHSCKSFIFVKAILYGTSLFRKAYRLGWAVSLAYRNVFMIIVTAVTASAAGPASLASPTLSWTKRKPTTPAPADTAPGLQGNGNTGAPALLGNESTEGIGNVEATGSLFMLECL